MSIKKLPWSTDEYTPLKPSDLDPTPAPTPEQRLRVAAAIATMVRDRNILGRPPPGPNAEAIRGVLTMSPEAWARDMSRSAFRETITAYDPVDPIVRFQQIKNAVRGAN